MDQLTVLSNQHYHFAKEFYLENDNINSNAYPHCSKFQWYTIDVDGIESLANAIELLEQQPSSFIVRGHVPPESPDVILRRMYKPDSPDTYLHDVARQWLMIDVDKLELPDGLNIVNDTETSIEYAVSMLPKEFHDISYYWSLSSSAGVKSTNHISVHLFFWLDKPLPNDTLRKWAMAYNSHQGFKLIDYALFNAVQPHYLANPKFRVGVNDPFEERQRSGLFKKTKDIASIDLSVINVVLEEKINTNQSRIVGHDCSVGAFAL